MSRKGLSLNILAKKENIELKATIFLLLANLIIWSNMKII